jgi:hypothetical protein
MFIRDKVIAFVYAMTAAFGLFMLNGCEPKQSYGPPLASECKFEQPLAVNVVVYNTEGELRRYWETLHPGQDLPQGAEVKGLATYNTRTKVHTLHLMPIRGQNDHDRIETIGHELMHSFCGDWHPRNSY